MGWVAILAPPLLGGGLGFFVASAGGALLGAVGGGIVAWAISKGAVVAMLRGAAIGIGFALLIGPGADYLIFRADPGERALPAVVMGGLVGGLLGVRNFRVRRAKERDGKRSNHP